jgi:hypothetical protein
MILSIYYLLYQKKKNQFITYKLISHQSFFMKHQSLKKRFPSHFIVSTFLHLKIKNKYNSAPAWLQGHHCVVRNDDDFWLPRNDQEQRAAQLKFF